MIIDKLENIAKYAGLSDHFAAAAAFLQKQDLSSLPLGRHAINDDLVYAMCQENRLNRGDAAWEAHAKYADIQLVLEGSERFGCSLTGTLGAFPPDADICSCTDVERFDVVLTAGQFVIYLPGEPHAPGLFANDDLCKKIVVKVRA